jgi:hypothetical protein
VYQLSQDNYNQLYLNEFHQIKQKNNSLQRDSQMHQQRSRDIPLEILTGRNWCAKLSQSGFNKIKKGKNQPAYLTTNIAIIVTLSSCPWQTQ